MSNNDFHLNDLTLLFVVSKISKSYIKQCLPFYIVFFQCSLIYHVRKALGNLKLIFFCTFSFDDEQDSFCGSSGLEVEENSIICSETDAIENTGTGNKYLVLYILTTLCEV